jgi:hypothetical protein
MNSTVLGVLVVALWLCTGAFMAGALRAKGWAKIVLSMVVAPVLLLPVLMAMSESLGQLYGDWVHTQVAKSNLESKKTIGPGTGDGV